MKSGASAAQPAAAVRSAAPQKTQKVAANVYIEINRISLLGDLVLHLLCSSFPDEPIGAIANFLDILSQNEKTHLQVVDPPRPSVEMNPIVREYLQQHRIAFVVEEWLGELCRVQPENALQYSSQFFMRMLGTRVRKGFIPPAAANAVPAPSGAPPAMPDPLPPGGRVASTLAAEPIKPVAVSTPTTQQPTSPVQQQQSSRPTSPVSDRSSLSPLQSRDELNNSPAPPPPGSLSPLTPPQAASSLSRPGGAASVSRRTRLLILVYSLHGHCEALAFAAMDGVMRNPLVDANMYRFPEVLSEEALEKMSVRQRHPDDPGFIPVFEDISTLPSYDGFVFIFPTRFGNRPAAVQTFLDRTGSLWAQQLLAGKAAGVMVTTATQHGGQERTIRSFQNSLLHHGMIIVGANPREVDALGILSVSGCSPYGASSVAGTDGSRMPSEGEMRVAGNHAARVASFAVALHRH